MLDNHPPHAPTHTWRDFLIHIATIVIGLLIAVGLEETVEAIHRRHEMQEARQHIRAEAKVNQGVQLSDQKMTALLITRMNKNLANLRDLGTPQADSAATLDFTWACRTFSTPPITEPKNPAPFISCPTTIAKAEYF
jgi:hypothetical protein